MLKGEKRGEANGLEGSLLLEGESEEVDNVLEVGSEGRGSEVAGNSGERIEGSINDATVLISELGDEDINNRLDRLLRPKKKKR